MTGAGMAMGANATNAAARAARTILCGRVGGRDFTIRSFVQGLSAVPTESTPSRPRGTLPPMGYEVITVRCGACGHIRHLPPEKYTRRGGSAINGWA